jgi:hypothetical protein
MLPNQSLTVSSLGEGMFETGTVVSRPESARGADRLIVTDHGKMSVKDGRVHVPVAGRRDLLRAMPYCTFKRYRRSDLESVFAGFRGLIER